MTIGMVPMSLGLESGSKMEAPLGRAVIGGLVMSTFATLLILPCLFSLVMGQRTYKHPSIDPDDTDSAYHDGGEEASRRRRQGPNHGETPAASAPQPPEHPPANGGDHS